MIGSDRVEGTNVYRSEGTKIGGIERVMLEKVSGKVSYAVMSFGGFLGIGVNRRDLVTPSESIKSDTCGADRPRDPTPKHSPANLFVKRQDNLADKRL